MNGEQYRLMESLERRSDATLLFDGGRFPFATAGCYVSHVEPGVVTYVTLTLPVFGTVEINDIDRSLERPRPASRPEEITMTAIDPAFDHVLKPDPETGHLLLLRRRVVGEQEQVEQFTGGDPAWRAVPTDVLQDGVFRLSLR